MESPNLSRMITNKNLKPSSLDTSSAVKPNFLNVNKAKKNIPYKNQSVLCSQILPKQSLTIYIFLANKQINLTYRS